MSSSSGSFDTLFFKNAIPLINDNTPFSTLTLLAVGPSSIVQGYPFYEYQKACGFQDTSTIVSHINSITNTELTKNTSTLRSEAVSTSQSLLSTISFIGKTYVSTIPYSSAFTSTYTGSNQNYPGVIITPPISVGGLSPIINTSKYNVYVDIEYSLNLNTSNDLYTWVSTVGVFNMLDNPIYIDGNKGTTTTTRVGNNTYANIKTSLLFSPEITQIPENVSSFHFELYLRSSIYCTANTSPKFDIYVKDDLRFTLVQK